MQPEDAFPQSEPLYPIKSWDDVPTDITGAEIHGMAVRDFSPLRMLKRMSAASPICAGSRSITAAPPA